MRTFEDDGKFNTCAQDFRGNFTDTDWAQILTSENEGPPNMLSAGRARAANAQLQLTTTSLT